MNKITTLRMERQHLVRKANESEYDQLYRDLQPGYNVYWNGFGDPPTLIHRANFDDMEYNRERQRMHALMKGRFAGGNLGWIIPEDFELFACAFCKPLDKFSERQTILFELIEREGPLTIQQMKESTGFLVKEITPVLHRLQEAFLIYEDQYDGEWDRGWYRFSEMFPDANLSKYTRQQALQILIQRFAYRMVWFDMDMAKSFYKLPGKDIKSAINDLVKEEILLEADGGYLLKSDSELLRGYSVNMIPSVLAIHKNDVMYRSNEHLLKEAWKREGVETLYYLLIDGEIHGAAYGKFRYGQPDFPDLIVDLPAVEAEQRKAEIIKAATRLSYGKIPDRYNGVEL